MSLFKIAVVGACLCASRGIRGLARPLRRAIFPMALGWVSSPRQAWRSPILGPAPTSIDDTLRQARIELARGANISPSSGSMSKPLSCAKPSKRASHPACTSGRASSASHRSKWRVWFPKIRSGRICSEAESAHDRIRCSRSSACLNQRAQPATFRDRLGGPLAVLEISIPLPPRRAWA